VVIALAINPTEKIEEIYQGGRQAVAENRLGCFSGFLESYRQDLATLLLANQRQNERLMDLSALLRHTARDLNLSPLSAGFEFIPHSTMLIGPQAGSFETTLLWLKPNEQTIEHNRLGFPKRDQLVFDRLVLDSGGNVILAATELPDWVRQFRDKMAHIYESNGFKPKPLDNLLHMTMLRLLGKAGAEAETFMREVAVIEGKCCRGGLKVKFDRLYTGNLFEIF
jgi:2'-5' RNA ligase